MKPLIASPSPREIPEFQQAIGELPDDILLVKYYEEPMAYKIIQAAFKQNTQYTHLVILPDDVIVKRYQYQKLRGQVEWNDYTVLSGTCNQNVAYPDISVTMKRLPHRINDVWEPYEYLTYKQLDKYKEKPVQQMGFEGFACCFIRRDIVEELSFEPYNLYKNTQAQGFDYKMALDCEQNLIPIWVDTSVRLQHLGVPQGGTMQYWGVGVREPEVILLEKEDG